MRQSARSEKKREAREAEEQRVRRFERHREDANKRQNETERMVRERILDATAKRAPTGARVFVKEAERLRARARARGRPPRLREREKGREKNAPH